MSKKKVMTVFGTRPEASKVAPIIKQLEQSSCFQPIVCVTAQHRQMLDQVLDAFSIVPDYDLNIMQKSQSLAHITTKTLEGLGAIFEKEQPDIVLVHGDTTTSFAAALAAFYQKITVGHVEAGLRTYNKFEPFPEEMNRKLTASIADIHFAPTALARENLLRENISNDKIYITGNTAIDSLSYTISDEYTFSVDTLNTIDFNKNRVIAMTAHRRENLGKPLQNICDAVKRIVEENKDVIVVYPVHKNPLVENTVYNTLSYVDRVVLTEPLGILDMHNLLARSFMVLTDSGGLQEEANKPVLVLRNVTERPEGVLAGTLRLAGVEMENIYKEASLVLNDESVYKKMAEAKNPFGDGKASLRIVDYLEWYFFEGAERPLGFK